MRSTPQRDAEDVEYEIERDLLTRLMLDLVRDDVDIVFGDGIVGLHERTDGVGVDLSTGVPRTVDLVFGCDGIHSNVRGRWFGKEATYSHFLKT